MSGPHVSRHVRCRFTDELESVERREIGASVGDELGLNHIVRK